MGEDLLPSALENNTLIDSGFRIAKPSEPEPPPEMQNEPDGQDDRHRPSFLLIAAVKTQRRELGK
jgi:hypothetical protein